MSYSFFNTLQNKFNIKLNSQQQVAVEHKDGPAVILAVPGAGKTTTLICRTANLVLNHNINPNNILSITFSKSSAKDMKDRFGSIFGQAMASKISFMTIHSFAYFIIREYAFLSKTRYQLIEGEKSPINKVQLIKSIYHKINNTYINDDKLEELLNSIGYVKNMMFSKDEIIDYSGGQFKNFSKIFFDYEEYKKKNNFIDFDDMLTFSLEILKNNSNMLHDYRNKYKYIQLDEGQDTSKIQNEIIGLISYPNNNLFVVADDDQSIYGFRGAFPQSLLNFKDKYPNAKEFYMEENFRSSKNIVSVSNDFIKTNTLRYEKNLFTNNNLKRPVTLIKVNNEFEQYDYILKEIKNLEDLSSTAILYRNNISSIGLIESLHSNSIPFYMKDTKLHFFNHWVTQDVLSFLRLALDNKSKTDFERIYFKMKGYISKAALNYVLSNNSDKSIFDVLIKYPGFREFQVKNISRLKSDFRFLNKKSAIEAISFIENDLEYTNYLKDNCKNFGYSYANIKSILSSLKAIARDACSIIEFIAKLQHMQGIVEKAKFNRYKNAITLSTIHGAKGLEFQHVYMIDLIDGDFPSSSSIEMLEIGDSTLIEEERRLFYVGMTRAKEVLDIITIKEKNEERIFPSRFVNELEQIVNPQDVKKAKIYEDFRIGTKIKHQKFGKGKIIFLDGDTIIVDFAGEGKQLSLALCVRKKLIDII